MTCRMAAVTSGAAWRKRPDHADIEGNGFAFPRPPGELPPHLLRHRRHQGPADGDAVLQGPRGGAAFEIFDDLAAACAQELAVGFGQRARGRAIADFLAGQRQQNAPALKLRDQARDGHGHVSAAGAVGTSQRSWSGKPAMNYPEKALWRLMARRRDEEKKCAGQR